MFFRAFFSELGDKGAWIALDYASKFDQFWNFDDNVERIDARDVDCDEFIERFEKLNTPIVIQSLQVIYFVRMTQLFVDMMKFRYVNVQYPDDFCMFFWWASLADKLESQ